MNTLVIGGTGFIGEYLCRALVQDGVIVVARPGMDEKEKIERIVQESEKEFNLLDSQIDSEQKEIDKKTTESKPFSPASQV